MPRFVILTHDHPHLHWDLLLEQPGEELLRTWRLARPPGSEAVVSAEVLPGHRGVYLDYEGAISGGRGEVKRWDFGEYEVVTESPDRLEVRLLGRRIVGAAEITLKEDGRWTFQFTSGG